MFFRHIAQTVSASASVQVFSFRNHAAMASDGGDRWTEIGDNSSMLGGAARCRWAIDQFSRGRGAMEFAGISVEEHEAIVRKVGAQADGEMLHLAIAWRRDTNQARWNTAWGLGLPWQTKSWSGLSKLQQAYNTAVETNSHPLSRVEEGVAIFGLTRCSSLWPFQGGALLWRE